MRHTQRQPDLVGGTGGLSVSPATENVGGGSSPESKSGSPEGVHGDELTLEVGKEYVLGIE